MNPVRPLDTRRVLVLGLGGLLLLALAAGAYSLRILADLRSANTNIRSAYLTRTHLLEQIRDGLFITPDADATDRALERYSALIDRAELATFADLRSEVHAYHKLLELNSTDRRSPYLDDQLARRRTTMSAIASRIAALNEQELSRAELATNAAFDRFRWTFTLTLLATLTLGSLLSWLTLHRMSVLNRERVRLTASLAQAQEDERRTIARELHDEVGQKLSALLVETANTAALHAPAADHLTGIRTLAEDCVRVVRNISLLLRPSMLDDLGLIPALEWQARETARRTGMHVRVETPLTEAEHLPDDLKTCVYRVVQEALNNAAKHARAANVTIRIAQAAGLLIVEIQDDGIGFDARRQRGLGLAGIAERAAQLGGTLSIDSTPSRGTTVRITIPLSGASA